VRILWATLGLLLLSALGASAAHAQPNDFRLKPGAASGTVCLDCHTDFQDKLKSRFVHTPVKNGACARCHSPHTSNHGKLLAASTSEICLTCHKSVIPAKAVSSHKVVTEGACVKCHDPHASTNKALLVKAGNDLCVTCHKDVGDTVSKVKFKHAPVSGGCLNCHDPHGSDKSSKLLKNPVPTLCLSCHKTDAANFTRQHANYPVTKANCVSCHEAHGSNTAAILFDTVHPPVAAKRCNQCHVAPTEAQPFVTRRVGYELCRGCHSTMLNDVFAKNRVHWPVVDKVGCLHCHEPHAARQKKLLNVDEAKLCGRCHQDTLEWQAKLAQKEQQEQAAASKIRSEKGLLTHQPVQDGACTSCHMPHASDTVRLMNTASTVEGCGACHDWVKHNSHPMGEKYIDMRNRNRSVDCLSCHRAHGTGNRYMITAATPTDLCTQCHKQLRR
jgi:DmsE family decaheme c-type cytochrome